MRMLPDPNGQQGGETPSAPDTADASAPSASPPPPSAPSDASPPVDADTGREAKSNLLDAVLKVVPATTETDVLSEETEADAEDAPDPQAPDGQAQAEAADPDGEDVPDDEQAQEATPAIRKKINKLLKQRRELR